MKLTLEEIARLGRIREDFMLRREAILKELVNGVQRTILEAVFNELLTQMEVDAGFLVDSAENLRLVNAMDAIYDRVRGGQFSNVVKTFAEDLDGVFNLNVDYFKPFTGDKQIFDRISKNTKAIMNARIGVTVDKKIKPAGFLDNFIKDNQVRNEIKSRLYNAVTGGVSLKDTRKTLKLFVEGSDPKKFNGAMQRYFSNYIYDVYSDYDGFTAKQFSDELELQAAIYAGGIIETTRPFCLKHNNKVYTRKEIQGFSLQINKPTGPIVPSGYSYSPFARPGGVRCRHILNWIPNYLAIEKRPDIEKLLAN